jgi:DNA processing protein
MSESAAWVALSLVEHLGGHKLRALLEAFGGDVQALLNAEPAALQRVPGIGPKLAAAIRAIDVNETEQAMRRWAEAGVQLLPRASAAYPARLRALGDDAPPTLFARGDQSALAGETRSAALVGTRHPSTPAREAAFRLGMELALEGWVVVSGLASGIDAAAHHGAASGRGRALAVLGSGVLQIFPPEHASLAQLLLRQGGMLLSEVNPDARASTPRLVARNRLISGLSDVVIIIETAADGGAMYAARAALAQGRALYALDVPASGNQALLAAGAVALPASAHAADVLEKMV